MDLSIIIPSFNTKSLLSRCLCAIQDTLKDSKLTWEVIVVDNRSSDGTRALLKHEFSWVRSILNTSNVGYGTANNQGIGKANGTWILCLNSDTIVQKDAIERLISFAVAHPRAFIGAKLLNEDGSPQTSCGPAFTLWNIFLILFLKGDRVGLTRYSPAAVTGVDWVSGACFLGRKESFQDVGLFDESIFMYMEEIEFLYRAKKKRYSVLFYPDAHVIHTGAASSGNTKEPVIQIYKGLLYFYKKHTSIMEQKVLWYLLVVKAIIARFVGRMIRNQEIIHTYEQALNMV